MRKLFAVLQGLAFGYVAYLPVMLLVELITYRRIDEEKTFYALYYPLGALFLLVPSGWKYVRPDEVILNLLGGSFLVVGLVYSLRRSSILSSTNNQIDL